MRTPARLALAVIATLSAMALWVQPAAATTVVRTVVHVDDTDVEKGVCDFRLHVHAFGQYTIKDYYDDSGFLYKTIATVGPGGPFTVAYTGHGTTLTQRNASFSDRITYNADGSIKTLVETGPYNKYTVPGQGVVLIDTGIAVYDGDFNILFQAGPHQAANGDFDAFCAAFG